MKTPTHIFATVSVALVALLGSGCELYLSGSQCWGEDCRWSPDDDVTPPARAEGLVASAPSRQSIAVDWIAPADDDGYEVAAYDVRYATAPMTPAVFEEISVPVDADPPALPGAPQGIVIDGVRPGTPYFVGVVAIDFAGNRSELSSIGPIVAEFDVTGTVVTPAPDDGDNALGYQLVRGMLDDDDYADVAVAAPFKRVDGLDGVGAVYVYFGTARGIPMMPDLVINGTAAYGQFGNALTTLDFDGDGRDDLAVGAPFSDDGGGAVHVFFGGDMFSAQTALSAADASVTISADPSSGWFAEAAIGWKLAGLRFDSDDRDDLAISAVAAAGGNGGVAILYGGTTDAADIVLSDGSSPAMNGAVVDLIADPDETEYDLFGETLVNLGPTTGDEDSLGIGYFQGAAVLVVRSGGDRPQTAGGHELAVAPGRDLVIGSESDTAAYFGASLASVADIDGDGVRDIAIGAYLDGAEAGSVTIVSGDATGDATASSISIATITGEEGSRFGSAIANNATAHAPDIDGDGAEDLVIVGGHEQVSMYVWYGDRMPKGPVTTASARYVIDGPAEMTAEIPSIGGSPIVATWIGDINGDGLEDLAWSAWADNDRDGAFEVLWDDGF